VQPQVSLTPGGAFFALGGRFYIHGSLVLTQLSSPHDPLGQHK
jgi:hypothetical protein